MKPGGSTLIAYLLLCIPLVSCRTSSIEVVRNTDCVTLVWVYALFVLVNSFELFAQEYYLLFACCTRRGSKFQTYVQLLKRKTNNSNRYEIHKHYY